MDKNFIKRILAVIVLGVVYLNSHGQDIFKPKYNLEIQVLLYKQTELMDLKAVVKKNQDGTVDELSFYNFINCLKDGKEITYPETQIEHMEFIDFDGKKRVFVSSRYTGIKKARGLWEIVYSGKITWYREYFPDIGSYGAVSKKRDFFSKQGEEPVFAGWYKKRLLKLTEDKPELAPTIKLIKSEADVIEVLKLYDGS